MCTVSFKDARSLNLSVRQLVGPSATIDSFTADIAPRLSCRLGVVLANPVTEGLTTEHKYLLVSSGRTGSTYIMDIFKRNGLGLVEEHLRPPVVFLQRLGDAVFSIRQWFEKVKAIATRNGVFGTKVAPHFFLLLWPHFSEADREYFRTEFQSYTVIYSDREDKVMQAVSAFRAERSGEWHVTSVEGLGVYSDAGASEYDFEALAELYAYLTAYDLACEQFILECGGVKCSISYEELLHEPVRTCEQLAAVIGVNVRLDKESDHQRLADPTSADYAERFRREYFGRTGRRI